jgi:alkanesulfonate monooxygenase SsuD/methylene tetrahydromethanopterin reductase-like flavin-dependent oxidoreductase (luciferase family)
LLALGRISRCKLAESGESCQPACEGQIEEVPKMNFRGELAVKFAIQSAGQYSVPELVRLAELARSEGFAQVWVNDNLGQRNIFVVLAAMAAQVPIKLGTSIVVPYFRNPVDIADSLAALTELTGGRELSVGIARGDLAYAGRQIKMQKPLAMVRETTLALKALLAGQTVRFRDYPVAATYQHILPRQEFRLAFAPAAPVRFYCGGNGPKILKIAGEIMDGALIGNHYIPLLRSGRLDSLLAIARTAAETKQPGKTWFDICEMDISVSRDRQRALQFARPSVAGILLNLERMGFSDDEFYTLGIAPRLRQSLREAIGGGATVRAASTVIPDDVVTRCFVAGGPEECRDQIAGLIDQAERLQFGQIAFAKLGPDYDEALELLRYQALPA